MPRQKRDIDTSTAVTLVQAEHQVEKTTLMQQEERERLIASTHQMIGQIKAADMFGKFANVSSLVWLQQVKESKIYKDLPGIGTWEEFCNSVKLSRQKVDLDLQNLATFGEEFLLTVSSLSVGYRELRKLRHLSADGVFQITDKTIQIDGEVIPLDPDHKEDLQAAIERVLDEKAAALDDAQATIKAKDRVLDSKDEVIKKQEKELRKLSKDAEGRDLLPAEDAFLQRMENLRTSFDGYLLKADPDFVMNEYQGVGEITPRMRAALIATLDYMKMQLLAAHDTAVTNYGDPSMNPEMLAGFDTWTKQQG